MEVCVIILSVCVTLLGVALCFTQASIRELNKRVEMLEHFTFEKIIAKFCHGLQRDKESISGQ